MEPYQIRIRGAHGSINVQQLTCYLCQAVLALRDRQNLSQTVELQGTGSAIPTCILIAELSARKLPSLAQITEFIPIKKKNGNKQDENQFVTGIRIKLTYTPSEKDIASPGYQQNTVDEKQSSNWDNLYEFVMLYSTDLATSKLTNQKKKNQQKIKPQSQNYSREQSVDNKQIAYTIGQVKHRGQPRDQNRGLNREYSRSRGGKQ